MANGDNPWDDIRAREAQEARDAIRQPKADQQDGPSDDPILLQDLEKRAQEVGRMLGPVMPAGVGFCFIMFTFDEGGWLTYVSNAERSDMIKSLKETLEKLQA